MRARRASQCRLGARPAGFARQSRGGVGVGLVERLVLEQGGDERVEVARGARAAASATSACAVSTIRLTSSSTSCWVASEVSATPGSSGPMPSCGSTAIGPIARLMPQRPTMWRAIRVSCWMSDSAPVVRSPNTISSAARPPSATLICASRWRSSKLKRSASGAEKVTPERLAARDDRDLANRVGAGREHPDDRVAGLVVGGAAAVLVGDHHLALGAEHDPLERVGEVLAGRPSSWLRLAASSAASLTRLARSAPTMPGVDGGDRAEVDVRRERHRARVHPEDRLAAGAVRRRHDDAAVEAARAQQRRVEDLGPVGGAEHDHADARVEAVHLGEDLVERLLALVVAAGDVGAAAMSASGRSRRARR